MNVKTITLSGAEICAAIGGQNTEIRNDGAAMIYASANAGVVAGADGVVAIPAGAAVTVLDTRGRVYLLGTGEVSVVGKDTVASVFKCAPSAGGSGQDDVARRAINTHAGNAEIHVTAEEKSSWNSKAELSDIPDSLPADGGNADTVDGKHADDFALSTNPTFEGEIHLVRSGNATSSSTLFAWEDTVRIRNIDTDAENMTYTDFIITPNGIYTEAIQDGAIISRTKINDNGNAAALDSHPAQDFVLRSEFDALLARVSALEGNT